MGAAPIIAVIGVVVGSAWWPTHARVLSFDALVVTTMSDPAPPPVDDGYWYLIRAENACGNGSYGSEGSHGVPVGYDLRVDSAQRP